MRSMLRYFLGIALLATLSLVICTPARGGGIEVPMQDGKAAGEADAFTAQADDPSAIFYNSAGLTQLQGTNASAGVYLLFPEFHVSGPAGNETMNLMSILPHFYAESDFGTQNWRFGIGGTNEFGINEDWGNQGQLAPLVDKAQLSVLNLAPTAAYRVNEHLSVGMSLNAYYGSLYLQRNVNFGGGLPPGSFHFRGDDFALGVTPSIMYKIDDRSSIGAYYRSPFSLHFDGRAQVTSTVIPEIGPSPAHATLNFPESAGIGYSYKVIDPLTLEADIIWTDWHAVDQLSLQSSNPAFNGQSIPAHWQSGFTFRVGSQYKLNDHWAIRAGYAYSQNAEPTNTFTPVAPDSNYHLFAVGAGYSTNRWGIDIAYQYILRENRHISNNVASPLVDGKWSNNMNGLMITGTMKF